DVVGRERFGFRKRGRGTATLVRVERARHSPGEIHRSWSCGGEPFGGDANLLAGSARTRCERHTERARGPQRRCTSNRERDDRVTQLVDLCAVDEAHPPRKCALIKEAHTTVPPLDRRRELTCGHGRRRAGFVRPRTDSSRLVTCSTHKLPSSSCAMIHYCSARIAASTCSATTSGSMP